MKRLNFTSFLFTLVLGLTMTVSANAQASGSADCQDLVNISVADDCGFSVDSLLFTSWKPSCLYILEKKADGTAGDTLTMFSGQYGNDCDCGFTMPVDSMVMDTVVKAFPIELKGWVRKSCGADTLYTETLDAAIAAQAAAFGQPTAATAGLIRSVMDTAGQLINGGIPFVAVGTAAMTPACPAGGIMSLKDTVVNLMVLDTTITTTTVDGTPMDTFNIFSHTEKAFKYYTNGGATTANSINWGSDGSARYLYHAYNPGCGNWCWGEVNFEFKQQPKTDGMLDTVFCQDLATYSRWGDPMYKPTEGSAGFSRKASDISDLINGDPATCLAIGVNSSDSQSGDLCADGGLLKLRKFTADHPNAKAGGYTIATDSLRVLSVNLIDSVFMPDTFLVVECNYLDDFTPKSIAEYSAQCATLQLEKFEDAVNLGTAFGAQYQANPTSLALTGFSGVDACDKVVEAADFNNPGVIRAWPYVWNNAKPLEDAALKAKLIALQDAGHLTGVTADHYTVDSLAVPVNNVVCNITASYWDHTLDGECPGEYKILRTWDVIDWCDGSVKEGIQVIVVVDNTAPTISTLDGKTAYNGSAAVCDADDDNSKGQETHYFGNNSVDDKDGANLDDCTKNITGLGDIGVRFEKVTNPWDCSVKHTFPTVNPFEKCGSVSVDFRLHSKDLSVWTNADGDNKFSAGETQLIPSVVTKDANGNATDYSLVAPIVSITLADGCSNTNTYYYYIKIVDKLPPVVVLHDEIRVTLTTDNADFTSGGTSDGIGKIQYHEIDAGSHDGACGGVDVKIRRKGSTDDKDYADFVHFDCDDLAEDGSAGSVDIEVRVTDDSGNTSTGWSTVLVENKNGPFISCEDVTISCSDPISPEWVGYPHVYGICASPVFAHSDAYDVDELCFTGTITRTWTIVGTDVSCTQTITITTDEDEGETFDPRSIKWPKHHTGENWYDFDGRIEGFTDADIIIQETNVHGKCVDYVFNGTVNGNYEWKNDLAPDTYVGNNDNKVGDTFDGDIDASSTTTKAKDIKAYLEACSMEDKFDCEMGEISEPTWSDPSCGLVGVTYDDETFTFSDGVCFKVVRRWAVIDWCAYDPNEDNADDQNNNDNNYVLVKDLCNDDMYFRYGTSVTADGYYSWDQEIKITDDEQPVIVAGDDVTIEVGAGAKGDEGDCSDEGTVTATASDLCGGETVDGAKMTWSATVIQVDSDHNAIGSPKGATVTTADGVASVTVKGDAGEYYQVKWRVEDGCNNPSEFEADGSTAISMVHFADTKAPVIVCYEDLSTNAMSTDGTSVIWASDYVQSTTDCSGATLLYGFKDEDGNLVPSLTLTCADIANGVADTWEGRVYVSDGDNEAWCEVTLRIADSNDACPDTNAGAAVISGSVRTEIGDMIESAEVTMKSESEMTTVEGTYAFANGVLGGSYELDAKKADDYMNGVSTLDLVLIQKHILGLQLLDSPFKVIAADINSDENVSAIDLVELRKLILGIYSELPNNASWRFAEEAQTFDDVLNPFPFVENINIDFLIEDRTSENFIGVKIGDVSGNAIANSLIAQGRSNGSITLRANDGRFDAGELVRVEISSDEFIDMSAFQFTLNVSGLEFAGVQSGAITMTEDNIAVHGNALTAAWFDVNARTASDVLFVLEFRAVTGTTLSNSLSIGSSITDARAYTADADQLDIALAFDTGVEGSTFELYQNTPNPFESVTTIGFQLAEAGPATMTVFDVTGKVVNVLRGQYARGYNQINLQKSDLGSSGVLYYQLESGDFTATRKMILID